MKIARGKKLAACQPRKALLLSVTPLSPALRAVARVSLYDEERGESCWLDVEREEAEALVAGLQRALAAGGPLTTEPPTKTELLPSPEEALGAPAPLPDGVDVSVSFMEEVHYEGVKVRVPGVHTAEEAVAEAARMDPQHPGVPRWFRLLDDQTSGEYARLGDVAHRDLTDLEAVVVEPAPAGVKRA